MSKLSKIYSQTGFTIIEILVAIAIVLIITLITIFSLTTLNKQVEIDSVGQNILSTLRIARSKTLASESETTYGVHFETSKYVLFSGATYIDGAASNKEYSLAESEINSISLSGGGSEVIFNRIRGDTSQNGTISIRLIADSNQTRTININSSGQVSLDEAVSQLDTRVTDSRHLHFDLGWSLQTSTTLTLTFHNSPNPDTVSNIAMIGFFDAGKTVFDWSGTTTVDGADQVIRVHTHSLDAFNTTLSVTRDKRYNDKALDVSIDSKAIVSYSATGTATVGAYGGTMTAQ